jgi:pimeloyl-ACP methyl ester carboxylesterase
MSSMSDASSMAEPHLAVSKPRGDARGIALVLHGGRSKSRAPVRVTNLAALRMLPFAWSLRGHGMVVARLRYRMRGWNGADRSPVQEARWALERLTAQYPDVPVALVGHSMGGRTALYVADDPAVRAVVALAPWIEAGDPVATLAARRVLIAHGDRDRMTDPRASASYARAAVRLAESISYVNISGERHAMLRRPRVWTALTTGFVRGVLLGTEPDGRADANAVSKALAGQAALVV